MLAAHPGPDRVFALLLGVCSSHVGLLRRQLTGQHRPHNAVRTPERTPVIVELRDVERLSSPEIGRRVGMSPNGARSRYVVAMRADSGGPDLPPT